MKVELLALELQKVFHKEHKTYWEETEAIKKCLNSYNVGRENIVNSVKTKLKTIHLFAMSEVEKTTFISKLDEMKRAFAIKHSHINVAQLGYYRFMLMQLSRAREMDERPDYCIRLMDDKECPICKSPLEDNGVCSDVGSNNCQYQA